MNLWDVGSETSVSDSVQTNKKLIQRVVRLIFVKVPIQSSNHVAPDETPGGRFEVSSRWELSEKV
jgi:hypothetical protein